MFWNKISQFWEFKVLVQCTSNLCVIHNAISGWRWLNHIHYNITNITFVKILLFLVWVVESSLLIIVNWYLVPIMTINTYWTNIIFYDVMIKKTPTLWLMVQLKRWSKIEVSGIFQRRTSMLMDILLQCPQLLSKTHQTIVFFCFCFHYLLS